MKKGWEVKKLEQLAEIISGQSPKSEFYNVEGVGLPFYQGKKKFTEEFISEPTKWTSKVTKVALKDDILMSVRAPVGPVNFAINKCCIGRGLASIRPNNNLLNKYLFLYLISFKKNLTGNTGAVFNSINRKEIGEIKIPLPPLDEQQAIVAKLDQAFKAIDQAKANVEQNMVNAEELFQSQLNQIFSQTGEGWEEKKVSRVFQVKPPKREAKESLSLDSEVSFASMSELGINQLYLNTSKKTTLKQAYKGYTYFKNEDVLLAKITPCFENGKLGIAKNLKNAIGFGSSEFIVYRSLGKVLPEFLYHFMNRQNFRDKGKNVMKGAVGHKRIPKEFYEDFKITYPSLDKQNKIINELLIFQNKTRLLEKKYQQKLESLEELKQSILEKAFKGELV